MSISPLSAPYRPDVEDKRQTTLRPPPLRRWSLYGQARSRRGAKANAWRFTIYSWLRYLLLSFDRVSRNRLYITIAHKGCGGGVWSDLTLLDLLFDSNGCLTGRQAWPKNTLMRRLWASTSLPLRQGSTLFHDRGGSFWLTTQQTSSEQLSVSCAVTAPPSFLLNSI